MGPARVAADKNTARHSTTGRHANLIFLFTPFERLKKKTPKQPHSIKFYYVSLWTLINLVSPASWIAPPFPDQPARRRKVAAPLRSVFHCCRSTAPHAAHRGRKSVFKSGNCALWSLVTQRGLSPPLRTTPRLITPPPCPGRPVLNRLYWEMAPTCWSV